MRTYPILVDRRGLYRIEGIKLLTKFPFGLFQKAAMLPCASETVVYPRVVPLPPGLTQELTALGHDRTVSRRGPGSALYNLRRYQAGDDSRAIHWMTTARQRRLIVRETEAEDQRRVTLALPAAAPADSQAGFEQAVELTASLVAFFHAQGYAIRLLIGGQDLPHGSGEAHFHSLLRALALCRPTEVPASISPAINALPGRIGAGELTLVVMSHEDPAVRSACRGVSRILMAADYAGANR
jgi:uncharacterized protein (DUF58 family)